MYFSLTLIVTVLLIINSITLINPLCTDINQRRVRLDEGPSG